MAGDVWGVCWNLGKDKLEEELPAEPYRLPLLPKEEPKLFMEEKGGMMINWWWYALTASSSFSNGFSEMVSANLVPWNLCETNGWQLYRFNSWDRIRYPGADAGLASQSRKEAKSATREWSFITKNIAYQLASIQMHRKYYLIHTKPNVPVTKQWCSYQGYLKNKTTVNHTL